jgi:hypothetical protein
MDCDYDSRIGRCRRALRQIAVCGAASRSGLDHKQGDRSMQNRQLGTN